MAKSYYKNKTYICFDADSDMDAYEAMLEWKDDENLGFDFHNAHELNNLRDGSQEDTIKNKLRERLNKSKMMIVLIGKSTENLYKYVRWEMEIALKNDIPIIAVNLNMIKGIDHNLCPPIIRDELVLHVEFDPEVINRALTIWKGEYERWIKEEYTGPTFLKDWVYNDLRN